MFVLIVLFGTAKETKTAAAKKPVAANPKSKAVLDVSSDSNGDAEDIIKIEEIEGNGRERTQIKSILVNLPFCSLLVCRKEASGS